MQGGKGAGAGAAQGLVIVSISVPVKTPVSLYTSTCVTMVFPSADRLEHGSALS